MVVLSDVIAVNDVADVIATEPPEDVSAMLPALAAATVTEKVSAVVMVVLPPLVIVVSLVEVSDSVPLDDTARFDDANDWMVLTYTLESIWTVGDDADDVAKILTAPFVNEPAPGAMKILPPEQRGQANTTRGSALPKTNKQTNSAQKAVNCCTHASATRHISNAHKHGQTQTDNVRTRRTMQKQCPARTSPTAADTERHAETTIITSHQYSSNAPVPALASPPKMFTAPPVTPAPFVVPPLRDNTPGTPPVDSPTTIDTDPADWAPEPDEIWTPPPLNLAGDDNHSTKVRYAMQKHKTTH